MKRLFILLVLAVAVQSQQCSGPVLRDGEDLGNCSGLVDSGTNCDLVCLPGFFQLGSLTLSCTAGVFDYTLQTGNCGLNCTEYALGPFQEIGTCNNTAHGDPCDLTCTSGTTLASGSLNSTCINGTYVAATAFCAVNCTSYSPEPYIDASNCTNVQHSGTCDVGCQAGTIQTGGSTTATCSNGTFTSATAVCEAACGVYPASGFIDVGTCSGIAPNGNCQVACGTGTMLISGLLDVTCTNGTYSTPTAQCLANCTSYPLGFSQGAGTCGNVQHGTNCLIACLPGSSLATGSFSSTCNNGTYSQATADCGSDCTSYPSGNNVAPGTCTTVTHSASCSVSCVPGNGLLSGSFGASCNNGTYNTATAVCGACAVNEYSQNNACLDCDPLATSPPGSVGPASCICQAPSISVVPNVCQVCANNTYWNNATGTPQCLACPAPRISFSASTIGQCYCPPGTQENGTGGCEACQTGYFNPVANGACTLCSGGVVTGGGTGCQCFAGQGFIAGSCQNCTAGFFNPIPGGSCQPCPSLSVSSANFQSCTCVNGAYISQVSPLICSACTDIPNCAVNVSCTTQFNHVCPSCLPGYRTNGAQTTCTMCPGGTYCLGSCTSCFSCHSGSSSPPASTQPSDCTCNPGYEADTSVPPFCYICGNGDYELNDVCVPCDNLGAATSFFGAWAKENCTCIAGYGDISGVKGGGFPPNLCRRCDSNEFGESGSGICRSCPPYSSSSAGSTRCYCDGGYAETTDINGDLACQRILYQWYYDAWGICSGTCGTGPAAALGLQYRNVYCYAPLLGTSVSDFYCDAAFRPAGTRSCTTVCPAAVSNVVATPYSESVLVTFNMPINNYTNVGPCGDPNYDCSETGGYCSNYTTGAWFCHLDTHGFLVMSDPDDVYTYSRSGRVNGQQGVLIKNLVNGRKYTFTVRTFGDFEWSYQGYQIQRRSELSAPSNLVTPQATLGCFGGCTGGTCINGECVCWPGYYGIGCAVTAFLNVTGPTYTIIDIQQGPDVMFGWYASPPSLRVDILLYESICRTKDWCYPIAIARSVATPASGYGTYSWSHNYLTSGKTYFVRVFISNRNDFWADSTDFVAIDRYCQDPTICLNGGYCIEAYCSCPTGFSGSRCEMSLDACQVAGFDCKSYAYSSGLCNLRGTCECILGWYGDRCEYPPGWSPRCLHDGTPENPTDWSGLKRCDCPAPWSGLDCGTCDVKCLNGGTPRACDDPDPENYGYCKCPNLFEGEKCETPYVSAFLTLTGTHNIDSDPPPYYFTQWLRDDIYTGLNLNTYNYFDIGRVTVGVDTVRVEIRFYSQQPNSNPTNVASGVFLRDRFTDALEDPNSQLRLETTSGGAAILIPNVPINDPDQSNPDPSPSEGDDDMLAVKIAVPIAGFIVLFILILVLYKLCSGGSCNCCQRNSGGGGGQQTSGDLAMEPTRS